MKIEAAWQKPIPLRPGPRNGLIYTVDLDALPAVPGVYVFGRNHGRIIAPIYIGESLSLRSRIKGHLNSLQLMRAIEGYPRGSRFLLFGTVKCKSKNKAKKQIKILERVLILHAQGEGHELVNKKGAKLPTDSISFTGNRISEAIAPRLMLIKQVLR